MENNKVPCQGFLEKLVLSLKSIFLEEDILKILIKRSGDNVVYTHRKCKEFSFTNVCEPCKIWFEGLQSSENIKMELKELSQYEKFLDQKITEDSCESTDVVRHQSVIKTTKDYWEDMAILPSAEVGDFFEITQEDIENNEEIQNKYSDDEDWKPAALMEKNSKARSRSKRKYAKKKKKRVVKIDHPCSVCDQHFKTAKKLRIHERDVHEIHQRGELVVKIDHPCSLCGEHFKTTKKLHMHERDAHEMHQKIPVVCDVCGKVFKSATLLKFHAVGHEKPYEECDICGLKVKSVKTHKSNVHGDKTTKSFICERCGEAFRTKERHDYHMRKHDGIKPFKCKTCGKSYTGRSGATRCDKMHKGPETYRYTCTFCGFKVMDKEKLRNHIRTHTREKPFRCPLCKYQAARRDYMRKHLASLHKDRTVEQIEQMFPKIFKPETVPLILNENEAGGNSVKSEETVAVQVKPEVMEDIKQPLEEAKETVVVETIEVVPEENGVFRLLNSVAQKLSQF